MTSAINHKFLCLQCPESDKQEAKTRGLCPRCYLRTSRQVRKDKTTWEALEKVNLAAAESITFPLEIKEPPGCWLDHQTFDSCDYGLCRKEIGAAARSGIPRTTLRRAAQEPWRFNGGQKLLTLLVPPPIVMDDPLVRVFPDSVLGPIGEEYRKDHPAPEAKVEKASTSRNKDCRLREGSPAMPALKESDFFTGEWIADDGSQWLGNDLCDQQGLPHKRLQELRQFVTPETSHVKIPGRVRCLRVRVLCRCQLPTGPHFSWRRPKLSPYGRWRKPLVHHKEDVLENAKITSLEDKYKAMERQKNKNNEWCLAPCLVAKRLGIPVGSVCWYAKHGIPWMTLKGGKWVKPKPKRYHLLYGLRKVYFWLETEVEEFALAKEALKENPGGKGYKLRAEAGDVNFHKPRLPKIKMIGKDKLGRTRPRLVMAANDLREDKRNHFSNPVPAERMSFSDIAHILEVTNGAVRKRFPNCPKGLIRCQSKRKGKPCTQVRMGLQAPKVLAKEWFAEKFPKRNWPPDGGRKTNKETIVIGAICFCLHHGAHGLDWPQVAARIRTAFPHRKNFYSDHAKVYSRRIVRHLDLAGLQDAVKQFPVELRSSLGVQDWDWSRIAENLQKSSRK